MSVFAILVDGFLTLAYKLRHGFKCAQLRWKKDNLFLSNFQQWLADFEVDAVFLEEVVSDTDLLTFGLEEGFEWIHVQTHSCDLVDLASTPFCHH